MQHDEEFKRGGKGKRENPIVLPHSHQTLLHVALKSLVRNFEWNKYGSWRNKESFNSELDEELYISFRTTAHPWCGGYFTSINVYEVWGVGGKG